MPDSTKKLGARMQFRFIDGNAVKRLVLENNMTALENQYAGLEVALAMQQTLAADTTLDDETRQMYTDQVTNTQTQMEMLDAQWSAYKIQLDALPAS